METKPGYQPRAEAAAGDLPRDHRADRQDRECIDSFPCAVTRCFMFVSNA